MKKKILYLIATVLLILIVANPGESSFTNFLGEREFSKVGRKANYIVCSVYSADFVAPVNREIYFAILGKFYKIE